MSKALRAEVLHLRPVIQSIIDSHRSRNFTGRVALMHRMMNETPRVWSSVELPRTGKIRSFDVSALVRLLGFPIVGECPICGKATSFHVRRFQPAVYCSLSCTNKCPEVKGTRKKMLLSKYGVDNPQKSQTIKAKAEQTNLERYGSKHHSSSEAGKERLRQIWRDKSAKEKRAHVQARRETMLERHGVIHHFQLPEVLAKAQESAHKLKDYHTEDGRVLKYQGWEDVVLRELEADSKVLGFTTGHSGKLPSIAWTFQGKSRRYQPDLAFMRVNGRRILAEVKSPYTLVNSEHEYQRNLGKFRAAEEYCRRQKNSRFVVYLVDAKNVLRVFTNPSEQLPSSAVAAAKMLGYRQKGTR